MADDKPEELECGEKKELEGKTPGQGVGDTHAAARTAAKKDSEENATREALDKAAAFTCPEECPSLRLDLELSPPEVTDITLDDEDDVNYGATASCAWTCKISCRDHKITGKDKLGEEQDLYCNDEAVIAARGTATGKGSAPVVGNPQPPNAVALAQEAATKDAVTSLGLDLAMTIRIALSNIRCPDRCPVKKVRIWLDQAGKPQVAAPDANDVVHCTVTRRYQIRVECVKK
jgi:hypothetical protein